MRLGLGGCCGQHTCVLRGTYSCMHACVVVHTVRYLAWGRVGVLLFLLDIGCVTDVLFCVVDGRA